MLEDLGNKDTQPPAKNFNARMELYICVHASAFMYKGLSQINKCKYCTCG